MDGENTERYDIDSFSHINYVCSYKELWIKFFFMLTKNHGQKL